MADETSKGDQLPGTPPMTKNGVARAGYVLGILSVFVAGLFGVMGALALVFSVIGLRRAARMPEGSGRRTARRRSITGIVLGAISIVLSAATIILITFLSQPHVDIASLQQGIRQDPGSLSSPLTTLQCPAYPPVVVGSTFYCVGRLRDGGSVTFKVRVLDKDGFVAWFTH